MTFDVLTPAVVAADHTVSNILQDERAARIVEQHAVDPSLPGLDEVIEALFASSFGAPAAGAYEAEIRRTVERVVIDELMALAAGSPMPQVRAIATAKIERRIVDLGKGALGADLDEAAAQALLARDIKRFLDDPSSYQRVTPPEVPPGAPIGQPALDWLRKMEPGCIEWEPYWR